MSRLCDSCRESYEKWIDYRFTGPLGRWRTDSPDGKNVELYWQRSMEALRKAREEREALSRWQCELIVRTCAGHLDVEEAV
ncbi:hypothetical protein LTT66_18105 [Nocardia gipuzkoensis]|uniref:hypothetical protein n=1 Tax=Nocardia gipuzkoensis TaxID=2749991 RepID=UPI001E5F52D8|nr:hypothetical protein [Nocardia gipuzkoensis]UGT65283.1 hypothetical protein LTT66_18105 [Nocardia gipuzkoensis]